MKLSFVKFSVILLITIIIVYFLQSLNNPKFTQAATSSLNIGPTGGAANINYFAAPIFNGPPSQSATGTISSSGTTVTGTNTAFTAELGVGDSITASSQTRVVTAIASSTSLTTNTAFSPELLSTTFTRQKPIMKFQDNSGNSKLIMDINGNVGIGTTAPSSLLTVLGTNDEFAYNLGGATITRYTSACATCGPDMSFRRARNTLASPSIIQNNDVLGGFYFRGYDGSSINSIGASFEGYVDGVPGTNDMPGRLVFSTTPDGSVTPSEHMRITSAGNVGIGDTTPTEAKLTVTGNINFTTKLLEDGNEILSGMIAPFASACPTGWSPYTLAYGRYIVGTPSGGTNAAQKGTAMTDQQDLTHTHTGPSHTHTYGTIAHTHSVGGSNSFSSGTSRFWGNDGTGSTFGKTSDSTGTATSPTGAEGTGATGTAATSSIAPYIQLTMCQKTAGADYAEWIQSKEQYPAGTIVSTDPSSSEQIKITDRAYDPTVLGVISTDPGWTVGVEKKNSLALALSGRVPVKIASTSKSIKVGDALTSSDQPGRAMRAEKAGVAVGKALEDWAPGSGKETIAIFVNLSWYDPDIYLTSTGDLKIVGQSDGNFALKQKDGSFIDRIGVFAELVVGKIRVGLIETKKLIVDGIDIVSRLNELSNKIDDQQKEIDTLKLQIKNLQK